MSVLMNCLDRRTWRERIRARRRKDLTPGESLPTIEIDVPMPPVRSARGAGAMATTERGRFYSLVARNMYCLGWEELGKDQREDVARIADTLAAALGVTWTRRGASLRRERG